MPAYTTIYRGASTLELQSMAGWIEDISAWVESGWDLFDPSHASRLYWPDRPYKPHMDILVAGCGASQAAVIAYSNPQAAVVGIDVDQEALNQEIYLRHKHKLLNLEVHNLLGDEVATLERTFDLIVASNAVRNHNSPEAHLSALGGVLKPEGVVAVMLDSRMAPDDADANHGGATVQDCLDLTQACGLTFQDWFFKSPYYPPGLNASADDFGAKLQELPEQTLWSVMEQLRNQSGYHAFIACRPSRPVESYRVDFSGERSDSYVPGGRIHSGLKGSRAFRPGLSIPLDAHQLSLAQSMDGRRSIAEIAIEAGQPLDEALDFFQSLWQLDFIALEIPG